VNEGLGCNFRLNGYFYATGLRSRP